MIHFTVLSIYAQDTSCGCLIDKKAESALEDNLVGVALNNDILKLPKNEIYSQWGAGSVMLANGEKVTNLILRYDGLLDQLIVSGNTSQKMAVEKTTVKSFDEISCVTGELMHFKKVNITDIFTNTNYDRYLQVLVSGKTTLYSLRRLVISTTANELLLNYIYIIQKEDGSIKQFENPSRRSVSNFFPEKKVVFRSLLRKQGNRVRDEKSLIEAIKLYNTL